MSNTKKNVSKLAVVMMVNRTAWIGKIYDTDEPPTMIRDASIAFLNPQKGPQPDMMALYPIRMPYGLAGETLKRLRLNPVNVESWAFVEDMTALDQKQIKGFLKIQNERESNDGATAAGIVLPTGQDMEAIRRGRR